MGIFIFNMKFDALAPLALLGLMTNDADQVFVSYISKYGKSYATREEYEFRLNIFKHKMAFVEMHNNSNEETHTVELNEFADRTDDEMTKSMGLIPATEEQLEENAQDIDESNLAASVDWIAKN